MTCLNCSTPIDGNFCKECGQKSTDNRFTIKTMATDLFFSTFHLEKKGLPHTIKKLTVSPGPSIKEFLLGKRLSLYPPFKYLVLMGALVIIFSLRYRFFHNEYTKAESAETASFPSWLTVPAEFGSYVENFFRFAEDQATLLNIAAIPVFAFFSWAFLSRSKYNFAENLILNTLITAQQLFFLLTLAPFLEVFPRSREFLIAFYTTAIMLYNVWVYVQFFEGKKIPIIIKSALVVVISYIYQLPVNFLIYEVYETYIHSHMHWIPHVYDTL